MQATLLNIDRKMGRLSIGGDPQDPEPEAVGRDVAASRDDAVVSSPVARRQPPPPPRTLVAQRQLAPFETEELNKLSVVRVVVEMAEYRVEVDMIKSLQTASTAKAAVPKKRSRLKALLKKIKEFTPDDEKRYLEVSKVPPEGEENMEVRNQWIKKTQDVAKAAVQAINNFYLPRYNDYLEREHNKAQLQRKIDGKKETVYKQKTKLKWSVGGLSTMIEKVGTDMARAQRTGRNAMTGHFVSIPREPSNI